MLGFSTVFVALGTTASALGLALAQNLRAINIAGGAVIVLMGLTVTGLADPSAGTPGAVRPHPDRPRTGRCVSAGRRFRLRLDTLRRTGAGLDPHHGRHDGHRVARRADAAHLAGRHHLILASVRGLAAILPRIELFTTGAAEIARLLEMCADDAAARTHGPRTVLRALLALSGVAPIPRGALGATGVGVLARAQRLAAPPGPVDRMRARLLLTAFSVLLVIGPVVTVLVTAEGVAMCG